MADYAVVKIGGSQYKVKEGDELLVDRLSEEKGAKVAFDDVFLLVVGSQVKIGKPKVEGAQVLAKVVEHEKGEKIRVTRFKAKSRYRKTKGFRAALTKIKIEKIKIGKTSPKASSKKAPEKKTA